ncbi:hypothetical protein [Ensifer canadensis]|uniref:hypothetical protein n=1 Tax=Ensifer canadensis TaxID=555315 RepID=UPI0035E3D968
MPSYKMVSQCEGYEDHATVDAADEAAAKEEFIRRYGLSEKAEITASEMVKSYEPDATFTVTGQVITNPRQD